MTQFIKIPKELFTNKKYKTLSANAKLLYALLLDRRCLSEQNGVCDKNGKTVVYCKREEARQILNISRDVCYKCFSDLKEIGLLQEGFLGVGKARMLYVENPTCQVEKTVSVKSEKQYSNKTDINNTNINKTELSQSSYVTDGESLFLSKIIFNAELEIFDDKTAELLESVITKIFYSKTLTVDGAKLSQPILRSKLTMLTGDALIRVVDRLKEKERDIKSPSKYLVSAIVNAADDYAADCLAGVG